MALGLPSALLAHFLCALTGRRVGHISLDAVVAGQDGCQSGGLEALRQMRKESVRAEYYVDTDCCSQTRLELRLV